MPLVSHGRRPNRKGPGSPASWTVGGTLLSQGHQRTAERRGRTPVPKGTRRPEALSWARASQAGRARQLPGPAPLLSGAKCKCGVWELGVGGRPSAWGWPPSPLPTATAREHGSHPRAVPEKSNSHDKMEILCGEAPGPEHTTRRHLFYGCRATQLWKRSANRDKAAPATGQAGS